MPNNVNIIIDIASRMPESFMASPGGRQVYTFRRPPSARHRFHLEAMADGSSTATVSYISDKKPGTKRRRILRFTISSDELSYTVGVKGQRPVRLDTLSQFTCFESEIVAQIDGLIGVDELMISTAAHAPPIGL